MPHGNSPNPMKPHQQAADELRGDDLGRAGEEGLGEVLGINGRLARKLAANRRRCGSGVRREVAGG